MSDSVRLTISVFDLLTMETSYEGFGQHDPYSAHVRVEGEIVETDGSGATHTRPFTVTTMVGVPQATRSEALAAPLLQPFVTAWYRDAEDLTTLKAESATVRSAISARLARGAFGLYAAALACRRENDEDAGHWHQSTCPECGKTGAAELSWSRLQSQPYLCLVWHFPLIPRRKADRAAVPVIKMDR